MADLPAASPYLRTDDDIVASSGDTYVVRRPYRPTMTAAAVGLIALAGLESAPSPASRPRRRSGSEKGYRPYPKLKGSLRNQPCPKCGRKLKRCSCKGVRHGA